MYLDSQIADHAAAAVETAAEKERELQLVMADVHALHEEERAKADAATKAAAALKIQREKQVCHRLLSCNGTCKCLTSIYLIAS
jgi:hypothetical protein